MKQVHKVGRNGSDDICLCKIRLLIVLLEIYRKEAKQSAGTGNIVAQRHRGDVSQTGRSARLVHMAGVLRGRRDLEAKAERSKERGRRSAARDGEAGEGEESAHQGAQAHTQ